MQKRHFHQRNFGKSHFDSSPTKRWLFRFRTSCLAFDKNYFLNRRMNQNKAIRPKVPRIANTSALTCSNLKSDRLQDRSPELKMRMIDIWKQIKQTTSQYHSILLFKQFVKFQEIHHNTICISGIIVEDVQIWALENANMVKCWTYECIWNHVT